MYVLRSTKPHAGRLEDGTVIRSFILDEIGRTNPNALKTG
jgi:hypothetical protein